jgi:cleavage stimulation factor subunit 3
MADNYNFQSLQDGEYDPANTSPAYEDEDDDDEEGEEEDEEEEDDYDPSNLHFGNNDGSALQEHPQPEADVEMGAPESSTEPEPIAQSNGPSKGIQKSPVVTQAPPKQRTVGGFVVDDDDEDDEDIPMASTSGQLNEAGDDTPQRSVNQTPINTLPLPDTSIDKAAQEHGPSDSGAAVPLDPAPNGAAQVSTSSSSGVPPSQTSLPVPSATAAKATAQSSSSSSVLLPKARLPQDKVGILEDRIADDPRGDVDAWMSLINEHQRRSKFDDARAVYERFFQIFPFAVSFNNHGEIVIR